MSIERSIYKRPDGTRVVTLPKSWVEILEKKYGRELTAIYMDLFDEKIIVTPKIISEDEQEVK